MQILFRTGNSIELAHLPPPNEVHIWTLTLDSPDLVGKFAARLTPDETARASRFHFPNLREKFILSREAGCEPSWANISDYRRAMFQSPTNPAASLIWSSNNSTSICRIPRTRIDRGGVNRVGIYIEYRSDRPNAEAIFGRFFSRREQLAFLSVPPENRTGAFYRAWTRKEAILKAIGSGVQARRL